MEKSYNLAHQQNLVCVQECNHGPHVHGIRAVERRPSPGYGLSQPCWGVGKKAQGVHVLGLSHPAQNWEQESQGLQGLLSLFVQELQNLRREEPTETS